MTVYKGVNYADTQALPIEQIDEGQYNAPTFHILDQFVFTADLVAADTILVGGVIPEGATLLDCTLSVPTGLGSGSELSVGWQASVVEPTGSLPAVAADPTAFFSAKAVSSAGVFHAHGDAAEGDFYTQVALTGQVQPVITCVVATTSASGLKLFIDISYTDCA